MLAGELPQFVPDSLLNLTLCTVRPLQETARWTCTQVGVCVCVRARARMRVCVCARARLHKPLEETL